MHLRDYFAAKAIPFAMEELGEATVASVSMLLGIKGSEYHASTHYPKVIAKIAYQLADAMMEERSK